MNPAASTLIHRQVAHSNRTSQNMANSITAPKLTKKKMKKHEGKILGIKQH